MKGVKGTRDFDPRRHNREWKRRQRVICARCGNLSSDTPFGRWCGKCYEWIINDGGRADKIIARPPGHEERIALYTARAENRVPLFS